MVRRTSRVFGEHDNAGSERVNISDIAGRVAGRAGVGRSAAVDAVDAVFEAIAEAFAKGEDVRIAGFGIRSRPACTGRNPRTAESLNIAASTAPTFKAGKALRDAVNAESASYAGLRRRE